MPKFGETAKEYADRRGSGDDEIWIKGFRDGSTTVRFLMDPDDMVHYREHYDKAGVGYFPCSEEKDCVGCTSTNAETKKRQHRYATCVLDEKGYQQVFKLGSRLHRLMQGIAQRNTGPMGQTLLDRDFTITRTGTKFNEITYLPEAGERYELTEFNDELYDIGALLTEKYEAQVKSISGDDIEPGTDVAADESDPVVAEEPAAPARIQPAAAKKAAPAKRAAPKATPKAEPVAEPEPEPVEEPAADEAQAGGLFESSEEGAEDGGLTQADFAEVDPTKMGVDELRDFLSGEQVEFPDRAPRMRLIKIAQAYIAQFPAF